MSIVSKKIRFLFLVVSVLLIALAVRPRTAKAETLMSGTYKGIEYELTDGKLTLTGVQEDTLVQRDGMQTTASVIPWYANSQIAEIECNFIPTGDISHIFSNLLNVETITFGDNFVNNSIMITNMSNMFDRCEKLTSVDLSGLDVSNVTDMSCLFDNCSALTSVGDLWDWNVSNVTSMKLMFGYCPLLTSVGDLSNWDVSNVTNMSYMFADDEKLRVVGVLSDWNTSKVYTMQNMFFNTDIRVLNLTNWDVSNVYYMNCMFTSCDHLGVIGDLHNWNTSKVQNMYRMFEGCGRLTFLDVSNWDVSKVTNMGQMFYSCSGLTDIKGINNWDVSNVTNMGGMFFSCQALTSLDLSNWQTGNVKNMSQMFMGSKKLTSIGDLSNWNTVNVIDMSYMFYDCSSLKVIDISNFAIFQGTQSIEDTDLGYNFSITHDSVNVTNMFGVITPEYIIFPGAMMTNNANSNPYGNAIRELDAYYSANHPAEDDATYIRLAQNALSASILQSGMPGMVDVFLVETGINNHYYYLDSEEMINTSQAMIAFSRQIISNTQNSSYTRTAYSGDINQTHAMRVTATVVDTYSIKLPATISLERVNNSYVFASDYEVGVKGLIADTTIISIAPSGDIAFNTEQEGVDSVSATLSQTVQKFANSGKTDTAMINPNTYTSVTGHLEAEFKKVGTYTANIGFDFGKVA